MSMSGTGARQIRPIPPHVTPRTRRTPEIVRGIEERTDLAQDEKFVRVKLAQAHAVVMATPTGRELYGEGRPDRKDLMAFAHMWGKVFDALTTMEPEKK